MKHETSTIEIIKPIQKKGFVQYVLKNKALYIMLLPCILYFLLFQYYPMYGVIMAFQDFKFSKGFFGSPFIGLENFKYMFGLKGFYQVFNYKTVRLVLQPMLENAIYHGRRNDGNSFAKHRGFRWGIYPT